MILLIFPILLVLAATSIILKEKTNFSKKRFITKPESIYIGVLLLLLATSFFILQPISKAFIIQAVSFLIIIVASYFISSTKKKENRISEENYSTKYVVILRNSYFILAIIDIIIMIQYSAFAVLGLIFIQLAAGLLLYFKNFFGIYLSWVYIFVSFSTAFYNSSNLISIGGIILIYLICLTYISQKSLKQKIIIQS